MSGDRSCFEPMLHLSVCLEVLKLMAAVARLLFLFFC
jgi:hypothetical protein